MAMPVRRLCGITIFKQLFETFDFFGYTSVNQCILLLVRVLLVRALSTHFHGSIYL